MRKIDIVFCICLGILMCITLFLGYREYERMITAKILYPDYYYIDISELYQNAFDPNDITDTPQHILLPEVITLEMFAK